jgi:hypothetical protein
MRIVRAFSSFFNYDRKNELKALSSKLGMEFSEKDEFKLINRLGSFQLFRKGTFRKISNLMAMDDDWLESRYAIFDYRYTIQQGKTSRTFHQTVFFMDSKKLGLPQFLMKPENFFHRIGKYLNLVKDIEFEAHPEFSEKYLVQSEFPDMLKEMVSPELVRFFTIENKWTLEGNNYFLILYKMNKKLPSESIEEFHKKGLYLVNLLQNEAEPI